MNVLSTANKVLTKGVALANVHAPGLLVAAGIAGFAVTMPVVVSCKKRHDRFYMDAQDEKMAEEGTADLSKGEAFKVWAHAYWPAAATFTVSAACVITGMRVEGKRLKLAEAALVSLQGEMGNLKEAIKEQMKEKDARSVFDKAEQKNAEKHVANANGPAEETGFGTQLCCDLWSGRMFYSDIEHIRRAFNDLNEQRLSDYGENAPYNDLYFYLGIDPSEAGKMFGWPSIIDAAEGSKDIAYATTNILADFTSGVLEDGTTYLAFRPTIEPIALY